MKLISIDIDGKTVEVPQGTTVLEAAQLAEITIPTLCAFPDATRTGFCRMCVVEVEGYAELLPACLLAAKNGMVVKTHTRKVIDSRKMGLEMLLAQHPMTCLTCYRNGKCQLQELARQYGVQQARFFRRDSMMKDGKPVYPRQPLDEKSPAITHDPNMCILCGLCIEACRTIQAVDVIDFAHRGCERRIEPPFGQSLQDVECTACGQCIQVCPVNAFYETSHLADVQQALGNPALRVVAMLSPMVGVSIGEEFGQATGIPIHQHLVAALKHIGFHQVFDTGVGADVILLEESYELLNRVKTEKLLPMLSSSSPAWIKYVEHFYPAKLPLLSSCKSPAQALGALIKSYYAEQQHLTPEQIFTVSLTPCTAEKFERTRPEMLIQGYAAVDACLTTKELASLLRGYSGDSLLSFLPQPYDPPFENASGAGSIIGNAGGMLEGVMRTFYELFTEKKLVSPDFEVMRYPEGFKEVTLKMGQKSISAAIVHGTGNVARLMEKIDSKEKVYHYVEIKGCPNGCAQGGGAPLPCLLETVQERSRALYDLDNTKQVRKAHENPVVKQIYEQFLKKPGAANAKKFLHAKFTARQRYL